MKRIHEIMGKSESKKKRLAVGIKKKLLIWAKEAHELDNSKTIGYYYDIFLKKLREKYVTSQQKEAFFQKNEVIEN